jgi:hypothetical protein
MNPFTMLTAEGITGVVLDPSDYKARVAILAYAQLLPAEEHELRKRLHGLVVEFGGECGPEWDMTVQDVDAVGCAVDNAINDLFPLPVTNGEDDVIAYIVREYDPGDYGSYWQPPDPGYLYYRFMNTKEIKEHEEGQQI